jgi:hypothetical protein
MRAFSNASLFAASLITALIGAPAVHAQGLKEGAATFILRSPSGKADTVQQLSKGRDMRIEGLGGRNEGTIVVDGDGKRFIVLDDRKQQAMVMSERDAKQMNEMAESMGLDPERMRGDKPTITKTGRSETVGGVRCEVVHIVVTRKGEAEEGDACVADGVGFGIFDALNAVPIAKGATRELDAYRSIVGPGKGLVKATTVRDGRTVTVLELLRFDARDVPASSFEIPAGYETQDIGDMMGQARGALERLKRKKP